MTSLIFSVPSAPKSNTSVMLSALASRLNGKEVGLIVEFFADGVKCPQGKEFDHMKEGKIHAGTFSASDVAERLSSYAPYARPFYMESFEKVGNLYKGAEGEALKAQVETACGVHIVGQFVLGTRVLGISHQTPVRTPADVAKLFLRIPFGKAWEDLGKSMGGKNIVPVAINGVKAAFERGEIDAQDNPLSTVKSKDLMDVVKQVVLTNHVFDWLHFGVDQTTWESLGEVQKKALEETFEDLKKEQNAKRIEEDKAILEELRAKGVLIIELTEEERAAFKAHAANYFANNF